jgi:hypothetical protein
LRLQAGATAAWWLVLWLVPDTRAHFVPPGFADGALFAFLPGDLVVVIAGSVAAARGIASNRPWAHPVLCAVAGAVVYAALWCANASLRTGGAWLATAAMAACSAGMLFSIRALRP